MKSAIVALVALAFALGSTGAARADSCPGGKCYAGPVTVSSNYGTCSGCSGVKGKVRGFHLFPRWCR